MGHYRELTAQSEKVLNLTAHLVPHKQKDLISSSLRDLHWFKVETRVIFKILLLVNKYINSIYSTTLGKKLARSSIVVLKIIYSWKIWGSQSNTKKNLHMLDHNFGMLFHYRQDQKWRSKASRDGSRNSYLLTQKDSKGMLSKMIGNNCADTSVEISSDRSSATSEQLLLLSLLRDCQ